MKLPIGALPKQLPYRFPIGATYVVEGYGAEEGQLRVISRYVVLPDGRRINVPGEIRSGSAPAVSFRRAPRPKFHLEPNHRQPHGKSGHGRARKKIAACSGTG
jgi:hypothetical protein